MPPAPSVTSIASVKSKSAWISLCDAMLIARYGTVLEQPEYNPSGCIDFVKCIHPILAIFF